MQLNAVAVDLAKSVFQLAFADQKLRITKRRQYSRTQMHKFLMTHEPIHLIMEACATSHYWGRLAESLGHKVTLLHAVYVRPYVRRNKTDSADADALLRAVQDRDLKPIPIKSEQHQALQTLHKVREQCKSGRVTLLNMVRALMAEFGVTLPRHCGEARLREQIEQLPQLMQRALSVSLDQAEQFKAQLTALDKQLAAYAESDPVCQQLLPISAIGVTTATALVARVPDSMFSNRAGVLATGWV